MMKSLIKNALMLVAASIALSACDGGTTVVVGGSGSNPGNGTVDPVVYAWYDVYGNGCATSGAGPRPGCNYYYYTGQLVKIMDFEDPYFNEYYYNLVYDYYTFYLNGVLYEYEGWAWTSPNGLLYDEYGNCLNQKKSRSRDVVAAVAKGEKKIVESAGKAFAAKYSLSEKKGIEIARALNDWAKLGKVRAKTDTDLAEFSKKLYGIDASKVKNALNEAIKGNKAEMKKTISEAAANWGTSEENMKEILTKWYGSVPGIE